MKLADAQAIVHELFDTGKPLRKHFTTFEVTGSVRRKKEQVHDIDIVGIMKTDYKFGDETIYDTISKLDPNGPLEAKKAGKQGAARFLDGIDIKRFQYKGISIDVYLAKPEEYETLVLIKTGSKEHNVRLATLAKGKGMRLYASGKGLWKVIPNPNDEKNPTPVELVADTEHGILVALLGKNVEPWERGI